MNPTHDHAAFIRSIATKHQRKERRTARRQAIGKALLNGVGKVLGRNKEKVPTKSTSPPSKSAYVQAKRANNSPNIGQLTPNVTPPNAYVQAKREASRTYQYTSQRQKVRAPYKTR